MGNPVENEHDRSTACMVKMLARDITSFVNRLLEPTGVSSSQAEFLAFMHFGLDSPSKIADMMGVDASNLSRMIRQFEDKGWLIRRVDDSNRTRVELELTAQGRAQAARIDPHAAIVAESLERSLKPEEAEEFRRLLVKVATSLEEGPVREMAGEG